MVDVLKTIPWVVAGLIAAKCVAQLWLDVLNRRNVLAHAGAIPEAFRGVMDQATYDKSVKYTLAKGQFDQIQTLYNTAVLLVVLFSGVLPWSFHLFTTGIGTSVWSMAAYMFVAGIALSLPGMPLEWYDQFRLEQRFGFNTTTPKTWWLDRLKGLVLGIVLLFPLLVLVLKLVEWMGNSWWLWAWGAMMGFQLIMVVVAPVVIMPLFNRFTPLPEGSLRERLLKLADRTSFRARSIQIMDGSKRSRHSNAFFTGFGGFRKIVLFDTLVEQLAEPELEAVLAHEIGHFKKKHIPKSLMMAAAGSLFAFYLISLLARQEWFYWWSRRYEYEADAYAAGVMNEPHSLIGALRKLNEKNLSNLSPHPLYSGFYYSHPTLLERESALLRAGG